MPYIKYLTEDSKTINSQLDSMLSKGDKPCLFAPTGTGKTTLVYERMKKEASRGYLVILAMPFTSIIENKGAQASDYGIESGISSQLDLTSYSHSGKAVQTTFEGAIGILKNTNRKDVKLYVDEGHIIIGQSKLRNSCSELLDLNYDTIGMTATPHHLKDIGFTTYKPQRAIETPKIPVKSIISPASTSSILHKLICGYNSDTVLQIRVNDKEEIGKACNVAKSKGIRYVAIYTADTDGVLAINEHSGLTEAEVKNAQKGIFSENVDLILNTSKMDCGLDFKLEGSRPFKMVAVGNRKGSGNMMPNIADLSQAVNRMRWENPLDADITIIGQFGAEVYKDSSNVFTTIKEATGTISALEHLHKYYWSKTQEYTEDVYREVLAEYNVNLLASAEVVIQNSTVNPKRYASIFVRLNQFDGTEQTIEMAKAYGFDLEQYFVAHDNCSQSPSVMAKASLINSQLQSLFTHYKADTPIQSVWNGERYLNKNAEALISVARGKQSKSDLGMLITRAEAKGELSKEDLNGLVETERKAVKKYIQIIYNVKAVKISDPRKKTIKLNVDKGASSVVTTKEPCSMAISEAQAPKSTNESINQLLATLNIECASKQY